MTEDEMRCALIDVSRCIEGNASTNGDATIIRLSVEKNSLISSSTGSIEPG
jgi:hypothetical protein